MGWYYDLYKGKSKNLTFEFNIADMFTEQKEFTIINEYNRLIPDRKPDPFNSKRELNRFEISREKVFPIEQFRANASNWDLFKKSPGMSPSNTKTYCYVKYLMNYGPWRNVPGDNSEFDAIQYLMSIMQFGKNNPYSLVCTSYVPYLFQPWIKNPEKPPLRTGMTQCIWNIRPMFEDGGISWYVSWRASRLTYLLGNIYGLLHMFNEMGNSVYEINGKELKMKKFYGHIVSLDKNCKETIALQLDKLV